MALAWVPLGCKCATFGTKADHTIEIWCAWLHKDWADD